MADKDAPKHLSTGSEIARFNQAVSTLKADQTPARRRMILGIDATASRQMTWQRASSWHAELFHSAEREQGRRGRQRRP